MPTYDYECDACQHAWELFQKITDDPIKKCPACGKRKARRLFGTGAALMFKGSGFYETDYRSDSYKKSASADNKSEGGTSKEGSSKEGGSSDAKSEKKSDAASKPAPSTSSDTKPSSDQTKKK
jgi:putative FmdB family regulatory protein